MHRVVLDANAVVSGLIHPEGAPGEILTRWLAARESTVVTTDAIVRETGRVVRYDRIRRRIDARTGEIGAWLTWFATSADLVPDEPLVDPVCRDPSDDIYLAAARAGRATCIVSGDPDLLVLREFDGVPILTPRQFLDLLGEPSRR